MKSAGTIKPHKFHIGRLPGWPNAVSARNDGCRGRHPGECERGSQNDSKRFSRQRITKTVGLETKTQDGRMPLLNEARTGTEKMVRTAEICSQGKETLLYETLQNVCHDCGCSDAEHFRSGRGPAQAVQQEQPLWGREELRLRFNLSTDLLQAHHRSALPTECLHLPT